MDTCRALTFHRLRSTQPNTIVYTTGRFHVFASKFPLVSVVGRTILPVTRGIPTSFFPAFIARMVSVTFSLRRFTTLIFGPFIFFPSEFDLVSLFFLPSLPSNCFGVSSAEKETFSPPEAESHVAVLGLINEKLFLEKFFSYSNVYAHLKMNIYDRLNLLKG